MRRYCVDLASWRELAAVEELLGRRSALLIIEVGLGIGEISIVQALADGRKSLATTF
jgi:hypothetical protein